MHYELYIDLLFLENFMMDSLLLLVLNRVLKCKSNWQRIFLGGGLGSGMMCLGIVVGIPGVFQLIFFHGIVSSCMLITYGRFYLHCRSCLDVRTPASHCDGNGGRGASTRYDCRGGLCSPYPDGAWGRFAQCGGGGGRGVLAT